jgi:hypothetical protein
MKSQQHEQELLCCIVELLDKSDRQCQCHCGNQANNMSTTENDIDVAKKQIQQFVDQQAHEIDQNLQKKLKDFWTLTSRVYTLERNLQFAEKQLKKQQARAVAHPVLQTSETTTESEQLKAAIVGCIVNPPEPVVAQEKKNEEQDIKHVLVIQRNFRRFKQRRLLRQLVTMFVSSPHAQSMRQRNNVIREIEKTEETYIQGLMLAKKLYLQPLRYVQTDKERFGITLQEIDILFINLSQILRLHQIFLAHIKQEMNCWPVVHIGDVFVNQAPLVSSPSFFNNLVFILYSIHQLIPRVSQLVESVKETRTKIRTIPKRSKETSRIQFHRT